MRTLLNESMSDSSNQFNLAYAFLVGVPINYQLPMFTLQCVTIFFFFFVSFYELSGMRESASQMTSCIN